jgi:exonuclease VII large subunit
MLNQGRKDISITTHMEEKMKTRSLFLSAMSLAAFGLVLLVGSPRATAQKQDSGTVSQLLVEAKNYAIQAENDAEELDAFTRSHVSWKSHASNLVSITNHINNLGEVTKQLSDHRAEASPWQQQAIDQIEPLLREMADHLSQTIDHLNSHQDQVHMAPYRDYVARNYALARATAQMIKDYVDYDEAKSVAEDAAQELSIPEEG